MVAAIEEAGSNCN